MEPLTAGAIATLAFTKAFEKTIEKFTEAALTKIDALRTKIWDKIQGKPGAQTALEKANKGSQQDLDKVADYLRVEMDEDPDFTMEIKKLAYEIQQEINISNKDTVGGSKVGRDQITVRDISGSTGIAIGSQATATVNITNQLQNSSNQEEQKLGKLLEQLQAEIQKVDSGLTKKDQGKALKHLRTIGEFGSNRQNSDLRDSAETALDALPTILSQETGFDKTHIGTLVASIKENLGF